MISNAHTRRAYARAVSQFLSWCEEQDLELRQVTPGLAGRFFNSLPGSTATKKPGLGRLAAFLRRPGHPPRRRPQPLPLRARPQNTKVLHGQNAGTDHPTSPNADRLPGYDARRLQSGDRALLGTMIATGARVGALCRLRLGDLRDQGDYRVLRFTEKGGKERDIPVRYDLDEWLAAYMQAAEITEDPPTSPLWRAGITRVGPLSDRPLTPAGVRQLLKRPPPRRRSPRDAHPAQLPRHGGHGIC